VTLDEKDKQIIGWQSEEKQPRFLIETNASCVFKMTVPLQMTPR